MKVVANIRYSKIESKSQRYSKFRDLAFVAANIRYSKIEIEITLLLLGKNMTNSLFKLEL